MSRLVSSSSALRASATIGHQSSPIASLIRSIRSWVRLFGVPRLRPPVFGVPFGRPALAISVSPYFGSLAGLPQPDLRKVLDQLDIVSRARFEQVGEPRHPLARFRCRALRESDASLRVPAPLFLERAQGRQLVVPVRALV